MSDERNADPEWAALLRTEARRVRASEQITVPATGEADELLEELQIQRIELEMQNESLRQAHIELERSRDRYFDLYEFSPVGYMTLLRNGSIAEANLTAGEMLGYARKGLLKRYFSSLVAREDADRWYLFSQQVCKDGAAARIELVLLHGEGRPIDVRIDCMGVRAGTNIPALRIALTDISEARKTEEELRVAAIAFESQEASLVTDSAGVILRVNQAFARSTGYAPDELVGKTAAVLKSGRHDDAFYQQLWTALKAEGGWRGTIWNKHRNGKIYAHWLTLSAVHAANGSITHYVGTYSAITQNREAEAEIYRLAYYDPLTHLPNRRLLYDRLDQAMSASARSGHYCALLYLDLDRFKILNDEYGHEAGDLLLIQVAERLESGIRKDNTIARLSGDEFVVILSDLSTVPDEAVLQARQVADKLRDALSQPYALNGPEFRCTVSIGVVIFHDHTFPPKTLLKQADMALYQAKKAGRNRIQFYDSAMQSRLDERCELIHDLQYAVQRDELRLFYQVQVDHLYRMTSIEALLRWAHPTRGLLEPEVFIPLAEETGLILPIGRWVLATACEQIKLWCARTGMETLRLSVNVSARQFRQMDFIEEVRKILAESGVNPGCLRMELTETVVINDLQDTIAKMHALKNLGITLAMDDFGTGYSSLSTLSCLPLDQLKIDQSFIQKLEAPDDANNAIITQSIITLGRTLGMHVIAEGVETYSQLDFLERHGCHAYQGFLFSLPLTRHDFETAYLQ